MSQAKLGFTHRLYTGKISYDFIGKRRGWYILSGVILAITIVALIARGLVLGIEFRGGTDFQVPMTVEATTIDDVRSAVEEFSVADLQPQVFSLGENAVRIQTRAMTPDEITQVRSEIGELADASAEEVTYSSIGASWGKRVSQRGAIALVVFVLLVMVLIAVWFRDVKMSLAAVAALAHDVVVTLGLYALVGFTVTPATLIGVLTILGYSLYDTVVVFDKVKENIQGLAESRDTYSDRANLAVNQVLVRSINTTVIGVLPVAALLIGGSVLGAGPLQDLGLPLLVGMIAGAYSSIFLATPILASLKEREPEQVRHRESIRRREQRAEERKGRRKSDAVEEPVTTATTAGAPAPAQPGQQRRQRRTKTTRSQRRRQ